MDKRMTGVIGEKLTCKYYREKGYRLLAVNYRSRFGEIDVIAQKNDVIVFCEVKTRSEKTYYSPKEAVTAAKQAKIKNTALIYIDENKLGKYSIRFDVSEVYSKDNRYKLNIIENAFE